MNCLFRPIRKGFCSAFPIGLTKFIPEPQCFPKSTEPDHVAVLVHSALSEGDFSIYLGLLQDCRLHDELSDASLIQI